MGPWGAQAQVLDRHHARVNDQPIEGRIRVAVAIQAEQVAARHARRTKAVIPSLLAVDAIVDAQALVPAQGKGVAQDRAFWQGGGMHVSLARRQAQ